MQQELDRLQQQALSPDHWADHQAALRNTQQAQHIQESLEEWRDINDSIQALCDLSDLAAQQQDHSLDTDLEQERQRINQLLDHQQQPAGDTTERAEGHHHQDPNDMPAILTVQPGNGGTEAQEWAGMLIAMYTNWARRHHRPTVLMDLAHAPPQGIRSATMEIGGPQAYRLLSPEAGVHRLVRMSPYDPQGRRHTSRASVIVLPAPDTDPREPADLPRNQDLSWSFFRSSGPGGQHVQKVDTAVRLRHLPTGITVTCQTARSQQKNRDFALRILQARLKEAREQEQQAQHDSQRRDQPQAEWGNRIRSYTLHPQQFVQDHRTGHRDPNPERVLQGHIDIFIEAGLKLTGKHPEFPVQHPA